MAAALPCASAGSAACVLFLFKGEDERAARASEPGIGVHFGHCRTIPKRTHDRLIRRGMGSNSIWDTRERAGDLHCCLHRTIVGRGRQVSTALGGERHEFPGAEKS